MRLVLYNIEYCEGIKGKWFEYLKFWKAFFSPRDVAVKIATRLKELNPDIVAFVEIDSGSFRNHKKNDISFFQEFLDMKHGIFEIKYPHKSWLRAFHHIPILRKQANAIISKHKLIDIKYHMLKEGTKRVIIEAKINVGKEITLFLVHLALGKNTRAKQLNELADIINNTKGEIILMGDFNTFSGENEIAGLLRRTHLKHEFKHTINQTLTQPAYNPKRRLDYILTSKGININSYEVLDMEFSDHRPIMIDFEI